MFRLSSWYKEQNEALKLLHDFTSNVIQERRKSPTKKIDTDNFDESIGVKRKMNLLDILLQSTVNGEPLSDLDIREEVDTFMFEVSRLKAFPAIAIVRQIYLHRVTIPRHLEYYFVCTTLRNIPTFSGNVSKRSERKLAMMFGNRYR